VPVIVDSHCHIYWSRFDEDRDEALARARAAGVERMVVVGTDVESSRAAFALAEGDAGLFPTAGIHPHDAEDASADVRAIIEELCARPECVAVGETGLDWFRNNSPREAQLDSFAWQLELAKRLDKPVIVHCRDAHEDTSRVLAEHAGVRGVMHCFTMGPDELPPYLELGLMISFSGVVTYPRNDANRAAAALVPPDRLLVETDCPFLAPQSSRGKRNEPSLLPEIVRTLAEVRGQAPDEVAALTTANAARLFGLPPA
jgi:TatD DNase family protein